MNTNSYFALKKSLKKSKPPTENATHARKSWKKRNPHLSFSKTILFLTILLLFIPLFVIIIYSFNSSKGSDFTGISLIWYKKLLFGSGDLWSALWNSLIIAFTSAVVSTILG